LISWRNFALAEIPTRLRALPTRKVRAPLSPEKLTAPKRELKAKVELFQNQEVPVGSIFSLSRRLKIAKPVRTSPELVIQHPVFGSPRL
jgi:hypothetical protein